MGRSSQLTELRRKLTPRIADAFGDLGYRRTTTAVLARRCGVQENILYRLWPSKKAMYLAAIDEVFVRSERTWRSQLQQGASASAGSQKLLDFESQHHGEFGLYRVVFDGLSEADDPEVRAALVRMYRRFHAFIVEQLSTRGGKHSDIERQLRAWALMGLGTVANITRQLGLVSAAQRRRLFQHMGRLLLTG